MPDFPLNGNFSWKRAWNQKKIPGSLNKTPAPVSFCGSSRRGRVRGFPLMSTLSQNAQAAAWRTRQPRRKYNYTYFVEIVVIIK